MKNERLSGAVLECALSAADDVVSEKLKKGEPLSRAKRKRALCGVAILSVTLL